MEILKQWIMSIVCVVIFVTILEIILPEGSIKKYVKFATGLLIMVIVISPIIKLFNSDANLSEQIDFYSNSISSYENVDVAKAQKDFKEKTKQTFIEGLKESMEKQIKNETGKNYEITNIVLKESKSDFEFGEISSVEIKSSNKNNKVVSVSKVQIGNENKEKKKEVILDNDVLKVLEKDFNLKTDQIKFVD